MEPFYNERDMFGDRVFTKVITNDYIRYDLNYEDGYGIMIAYNVFPGIQLIFNEFNTESCFHKNKLYPNVIEINHCLKGRFECEFANHKYAYIGQGDLAVNRLSKHFLSSSFPLSNYEGLCILLDMDIVLKKMKRIFSELSIDLKECFNKLKLEENCFVIRSNEKIEHIFKEMYEAKANVKKGYYKIKVLELLLFLGIDENIKDNSIRRYYSKNQIEVVKNIRNILINKLNRKIKIEDIVKSQNIGLTTFKNCFKEIYGEAPYAYLKRYRMNAASVLLKDTNINVNEIAIEVGYENASKFSKAFKDNMGISPKEYRKRYCLFGVELDSME